MGKDLSAVGAAASSSKDKTDLAGDLEFTGSGSFSSADNGYVLTLDQRRKKKGDKRDQSVFDYAKPKQIVCKTAAELCEALEQALGADDDDAADDGK